MTSREKFEAWWVKGNDGCQPRSGWEKLRTDDGYNDEFIDFQYEGFKAAEEVFQQQLEESQREFRAADATIHNLELKLTDMAVQLANAESKCRDLAAENEKRNTHSEALAVDNAALREVVERMVNQFAMSGISPEEKSINPAKSLMFDAKSALFMPATDAYLAEVLASAIPDEATERDLFEEWVMEKIFISKATLEGLRTDDGYRNSTLSGTDYNGMWSQWKAIRAAQLRQEAAQ